MNNFKQAMDEAAYNSILKIHPEIIESLKGELANGGTAKQIERRLRGKYGDNHMTAMSAVCAAYHLEHNPELLKVQT